MGRKLTRFWQLDGKDKLLLFQVIGWLAIARIMLAANSFERLSEKLADAGESTGVEPSPEELRRLSTQSARQRTMCHGDPIASPKVSRLA